MFPLLDDGKKELVQTFLHKLDGYKYIPYVAFDS